MSLFLIPSLIALIAKLIIVFVYRKSILESGFFKLMVLAFACHNFCEVLLFWEYFRGVKGDYLLRTYHVISLFALLAIVLSVEQISKQESRLPTKIIQLVVGCISVLFLTTDLFVTGAAPLSYVMTSLRGEFYWVFQVASVAIVLYLVSLLYFGYKKSDDHHIQIRCLYTGLALLPQIIAVLTVIILMNLGLKINAVVILPIATTLFILIMAISESKHQITDIRRFVPFSEERRTSNQIMEIFSRYAQDKVNYRDSVSEIEKLLVEHKYEKNDFNATYAAKKMGMPRSSLYSLFNRLGIKKQ